MHTDCNSRVSVSVSKFYSECVYLVLIRIPTSKI